MKIAIIGSGPAAFGALTRLTEMAKRHDITIDVFTTGSRDQEVNLVGAYRECYTNSEINEHLKAGKKKSPGGVLPPRIFNGIELDSFTNAARPTGIKVSNTFGGIGNYWSAATLPTLRHLDPIEKRLGDLSEHYKFISKSVFISGDPDDPLSHFFDGATVNAPAMEIAPRLKELFHRPDGKGDLEMAIGLNRFAIDTRPGHKNNCIYCGDCMYGCPRDAIFRAARVIHAIAAEGKCRICFEKADRVIPTGNGAIVETGRERYIYDRVLLCGGALNSMELIMKSYGAPARPLYLYDNMLWYFPAFSMRPKSTRLKDKTFAFAELAGGIFDHKNDQYSHILISTLPNAVAENKFYKNAFSALATNILSRHLILCAVYGTPQEYRRYQIGSSSQGPVVESVTTTAQNIAPEKFKYFRKHLANHGWRTNPAFVQKNDTSGHYTGNIGEAYRSEKTSETGRFDNNVFICDTSSWQASSMSQQHTFTVMANASRIASTII